nr:hypothetical protein [Nostoc sp. DedSLP05]
IEVWQQSGGIFISQSKYTHSILERFHMLDCKSSSTPMEPRMQLGHNDDEEKVDPTLYRQLVGSLIYLTSTRLDISYSVGVTSRFMHDPRKSHWVAAKRILRYLKGTPHHGLSYTTDSDFSLTGFSDSDWAGCPDTRRSTSGYCFQLGKGTISWSTKKQNTVSLSTAEAEYKASVETVREAVSLRQLLRDVGLPIEGPTNILCDNQSAIKMTKNPVFHARTKHIEIYHHYIRDLVQDHVVHLEYIPTQDQVADLFTKSLGLDKFGKFRDMLYVCCNESQH